MITDGHMIPRLPEVVYNVCEKVRGSNMKLLIVDNLGAGIKDGSTYEFVRAFAQDGDEVVIRPTDGHTRIEGMLGDAESFDGVIAAGGDGTVAAVCSALRFSGVPILPFPAGTANLTTLNLDSPDEVHALAKLVREMRTLDFDLGEFETSHGKTCFVMMAGAGFDGSIMKTAAPLKQRLGSLAYYQAVMQNVTPPVAHFTLDLDGVREEVDALGVLGINFSQMQAGVSITHENRPRDGLLDIALLKGKTAFDLIPAAGAALRDIMGDEPSRAQVEFRRAREVHATFEPALDTQYDGEPLQTESEFTLRVLSSATRFFVTEDTYRTFA